MFVLSQSLSGGLSRRLSRALKRHFRDNIYLCEFAIELFLLPVIREKDIIFDLNRPGVEVK